MKNPFKSVGKLFTKGGNSIAKGAKSIFSKNTANTFRNHLQDTLQEQGKILSTVGKIAAGAAVPLMVGASVLQPELIPLFAGLGAAGVGVGSMGVLESSAGNLLSPSIYKGNKLKATGNVVNQIEKAGKSGSKLASFA
jgi:hypothetical protein